MKGPASSLPRASLTLTPLSRATPVLFRSGRRRRCHASDPGLGTEGDSLVYDRRAGGQLLVRRACCYGRCRCGHCCRTGGTSLTRTRKSSTPPIRGTANQRWRGRKHPTNKGHTNCLKSAWSHPRSQASGFRLGARCGISGYASTAISLIKIAAWPKRALFGSRAGMQSPSVAIRRGEPARFA